MKKITKLNLNKSLEINEEYKKIITSAEKGRYSYFDYDRESVQAVAKKNIKDVKQVDCFILVQALFPEYLICSGLIDCFLMFEIKNNYRVDPPKYYYSTLGSFLNNNKEVQANFLIDEIMDLFDKNNIECDNSWREYHKDTLLPREANCEHK